MFSKVWTLTTEEDLQFGVKYFEETHEERYPPIGYNQPEIVARANNLIAAKCEPGRTYENKILNSFTVGQY